MYAPKRNLRLIHCTQSYHILLHEVAVYFLNCLRFAAAGLQASKVYVTAPFLPTTLFFFLTEAPPGLLHPQLPMTLLPLFLVMSGITELFFR